MRTVLTRVLLIAGVATVLLGCNKGPELCPATGTVFYKGQAVQGAVVSFRSEATKTIATGTTDAQGRFELTTYQAGKGAAAGKHAVTLTKFPAPAVTTAGSMSMEDAAKKAPKAPTAPPKNQLPAKYADLARPVLELEVLPGKTNDFKIELAD